MAAFTKCKKSAQFALILCGTFYNLTNLLMSYKHTINAALANLGEIERLLADLHQGGPFTMVEMDLLLQKTRNFYDILLMLKQTGVNQVHPGLSEMTAAKADQAVLDTQGMTGKQAGLKDNPPEIVKQESADSKKPDSSLEIQKEKTKGISGSPKSKAYVHESLQQNVHYQDLSARLHTQPVTDIAAAIGINEKFLMIRELFGNDAKKFDVAIRVLNDAVNFNEAYNYLIRDYIWDMDSELVQGLLEVIRRKFITGQHE
jgi:hypothetical protein